MQYKGKRFYGMNSTENSEFKQNRQGFITIQELRVLFQKYRKMIRIT